jgi:hypothetical protein
MYYQNELLSVHISINLINTCQIKILTKKKKNRVSFYEKKRGL